MLNRDDIAALHRDSKGRKVLSVYLNGGAKDFSKRGAWKTRMEHAASEIRQTLASAPNGERSEFDSALNHVLAALAPFEFLPDQGWAGFAGGDRLLAGGSTRVPMPNLVRWDEGARMAPYVRALKQHRLVVGILMDSRRGRLFEYRDGQLQEAEDLLADTFMGDMADVHVSRRATGFTGVRGETGVDAAQRALDVEAGRLTKRMAEHAVARLGEKGILVVGGVPEAMRALMGHLPSPIRDRTIERPSTTVEMSAQDAVAMIEGAASELNQRLQERLLADVFDQARSGGKGALGREAVERALAGGQVDTLLLSRNFIRDEPELADRFVDLAIEFHAEFEELSNDGAARLDTESGGVAARLRYI